MRNVDHPNRHLGSINAKVILVMLDNFKKSASELTSDFDRWMFALKDEHIFFEKSFIRPFKSVSNFDKIAVGSGALHQFYAQLHTRNIDDYVLEKYIKQIMVTNEFLCRISTEAIKEGIAIGEKEGRALVRRKVALKMLSKNNDDADIIELTGLTASELIELKNQS